MAAASLKLGVGRGKVSRQNDPRPNGRGLIEAWVTYDARRTDYRDPRPNGRGLIEATPALRRKSPALVDPRPNGRGLIEAPWARWTSS